MDKVYMIKYLECGYDGMTTFDDKAFISYREASSYLTDKGYEVDWELEYALNPNENTYSYELHFTLEEANGYTERTWLATINELSITQ